MVLRAAGKIPEENNAFQPTPELRSSGQRIGHAGYSQRRLCAMVNGLPGPPAAGEESAKAGLIAGWKDSNATCDAAFENLTDANATGVLKIWGGSHTRVGGLFMPWVHACEQYGNILPYMPESTGDAHQRTAEVAAAH